MANLKTMINCRRLILCCVFPTLVLLAPMPGQASPPLTDEIQVYTDDINKAGEFGLEAHVNATLKGVSQPDFPGAVRTHHGIRVTPELSYGLSRDFEAGLYLPAVRDASGNLYLPGVKLRLKWIPLHSEDTGGWYLGANEELSSISGQFSQSRYASELRLIAGYRSDAWLFGVNPVFGWDLSSGQTADNPQFKLGWKISRNVATGIALGMEYYSAMGKWRDFLPREQQDRSIFLVMDFDRKPWNFNIGIGKGLTLVSDDWTIKAIFEIPFD